MHAPHGAKLRGATHRASRCAARAAKKMPVAKKKIRQFRSANEDWAKIAAPLVTLARSAPGNGGGTMSIEQTGEHQGDRNVMATKQVKANSRNLAQHGATWRNNLRHRRFARTKPRFSANAGTFGRLWRYNG